MRFLHSERRESPAVRPESSPVSHQAPTSPRRVASFRISSSSMTKARAGRAWGPSKERTYTCFYSTSVVCEGRIQTILVLQNVLNRSKNITCTLKKVPKHVKKFEPNTKKGPIKSPINCGWGRSVRPAPWFVRSFTPRIHPLQPELRSRTHSQSPSRTPPRHIPNSTTTCPQTYTQTATSPRSVASTPWSTCAS